jgi:hypothetical protein
MFFQDFSRKGKRLFISPHCQGIKHLLLLRKNPQWITEIKSTLGSSVEMPTPTVTA